MEETTAQDTAPDPIASDPEKRGIEIHETRSPRAIEGMTTITVMIDGQEIIRALQMSITDAIRCGRIQLPAHGQDPGGVA